MNLQPAPESLARFSETIGYSALGRPLVVQYGGDPNARLRVFLVAGQHGDEADAREAASTWLARIGSGSPGAPQIAILADANPDGAAAATRRNALDIDLNRDHLMLSAPETAAIHSFAHRWQPGLIIDVHTYRPWRPELLPYDLVFPQDVMVDVSTNPAATPSIPADQEISLWPFVKHRMAEASFRCDRYTLVRPPVVRHSNLDIIDARNSLAVRYGIPAVLLEGRRSSVEDLTIFPSPHLALVRAIEAVVEWAEMNAPQSGRSPGGRAGRNHPVPVRCHYIASNVPTLYMEMQSATLGDFRVVSIPGLYLPSTKITKMIYAPGAYAVPRSCSMLLETLAKHDFQTVRSGEFSSSTVEAYRMFSTLPLPDEDSFTPPVHKVESIRVDLEDYVLFPTDQPGGNTLVLMLEPESQFGAHRFPEAGLTSGPGLIYPVLRVV